MCLQLVTLPGGLGSGLIPDSVGLTFPRPLSSADITALRQQVEALRGQVQHLQNTFSQYRKGKFLSLNGARH